MARATVGSLGIDLGVNTARLKSGLNDANKSFTSFKKRASKQMQSFGRVMKKVGMAVVAFGAAAAVAMRKAITSIDDMTKASRRSGISVELFQKWRFAADLAGVSSEKFASSLERFNKRLGEAARGQGGLLKTLKELDVQYIASDGSLRNVEDVMRDFADALGGIKNQSLAAAAAAAAFGREGVGMFLMVKDGNESLKAYEKEAERFGVVTNKNAVAAERANDALARISQVIKVNFLNALAEAMPAVERMANHLANWVPKIIESVDEMFKSWDRSARKTLNADIARFQSDLKDIALEIVRAETMMREAEREGLNQSHKDKRLQTRNRLLDEQIRISNRLIDVRGRLAAMDSETPSLLPRKTGVDPEGLLPPEGAGTDTEGMFDPVADLTALKASLRSKEQALSDSFQEQLKIISKYLEHKDAKLKISETEAIRLTQLTIERYKEGLMALRDNTDEFAQMVANSISENLFIPFNEGVEGMIDSFKRGLQQMLQEALRSKIFDLLKGGKEGGFLSKIGGLFEKDKAEGRATGGPVSRGRPYVVGERGPELFIPSQSGAIAASGAGGTVVIENNNDFRGADPASEARLIGQMDIRDQQTIATIRDLIRRRRFP